MPVIIIAQVAIKEFAIQRTITHDVKFLSQPSRPATKNDLPTGQDLIDTLKSHQNDCLGMAANMIGKNVAIIAIFVGPMPILMFNPKIIDKNGRYQTKEGCLSLTRQRKCARFKEITVRYQDQAFHFHSVKLQGLVAETVQHEIDHLAGHII